MCILAFLVCGDNIFVNNISRQSSFKSDPFALQQQWEKWHSTNTVVVNVVQSVLFQQKSLMYVVGEIWSKYNVIYKRKEVWLEDISTCGPIKKNICYPHWSVGSAVKDTGLVYL